MKTTNSKRSTDADTMRPEYDFSKAVRGVTAARYAQGTNLVFLDQDVAELFPDSLAVNDALRTFAKLARVTRRPHLSALPSSRAQIFSVRSSNHEDARP